MRFRTKGKVFHFFDRRMLKKGWRGGMVNEPAGFWMFVVCGLAPFFPLGAHYIHKWGFGINMNEVPATRTREEHNYAGLAHFYEDRREDATDLGYIYEYHYADGSKEFKFDYPREELIHQINNKRQQQNA